MLQGKDSPRRHSFSSTIKSELLIHKNVHESTGKLFFWLILGVIGDKLSVYVVVMGMSNTWQIFESISSIS